MTTHTDLVRFDGSPGDDLRPSVTPLYQTATFAQKGLGEPPGGDARCYDYTRSGNPTRDVLHGQLARLEGARHAQSYTSGMAALTGLVELVPAGGRIVAGDDLYGGTWRLLDHLATNRGVTVDLVDASDLQALGQALSRATSLVLLESPSNPLQKSVDLERAAELAQGAGALLAVDNTFLSPWLQRPLDWGADLVVHSATKHLSGHGDVTAGAIMSNDDELSERLAWLANATGAALAPFDSWLLLRGLKTLGVRVDRAQAGARLVAQALAEHSAVTAVHYGGLPGHPGADILARQAQGPGTVVSFETGSLAMSQKLLETLTMFSVTVSFGSVSSSVSLPCAMSHASIPEGERRLPTDLIRVSVGLEEPQDLIEDLVNGLSRVREESLRPAVPTEPPGSPAGKSALGRSLSL